MKKTKVLLEKELFLLDEVNKTLRHQLDEANKALRNERNNSYDERRKSEDKDDVFRQLKIDNILNQSAVYNTCITLIKYVNDEGNTHRQKSYHCHRANIVLAKELDILRRNMDEIVKYGDGRNLPF